MVRKPPVTGTVAWDNWPVTLCPGCRGPVNTVPSSVHGCNHARNSIWCLGSRLSTESSGGSLLKQGKGLIGPSRLLGVFGAIWLASWLKVIYCCGPMGTNMAKNLKIGHLVSGQVTFWCGSCCTKLKDWFWKIKFLSKQGRKRGRGGLGGRRGIDGNEGGKQRGNVFDAYDSQVLIVVPCNPCNQNHSGISIGILCLRLYLWSWSQEQSQEIASTNISVDMPY